MLFLRCYKQVRFQSACGCSKHWSGHGLTDRCHSGLKQVSVDPRRRQDALLTQQFQIPSCAVCIYGECTMTYTTLAIANNFLTLKRLRTFFCSVEISVFLSFLTLETSSSHPHAVARTLLCHRPQVRLDGLGVTVHVKRAPGAGGRGSAIPKGKPVKVVIDRVEPQLKQVVATEYDEDEG